MAGHSRVPQYLREIACVAYLLRNRERARDLLDAGDHAAFRQQAVRFFGPAPANVDPQDYIAGLQDAVRTQKSFFEWLDAWTVFPGGVSFSGQSLARRRAKLRTLFLADEDFATAHRQYFIGGNIYAGPNGELFDAFATWTMREHPGWTTLSDIEKHCNRKEPWEAPEWVSFIVAWVLVAEVIALLVLSAAVVVGRFPRDLERVQAIKGLARMSQVHYDTGIQKSTDLLGSLSRYGMLAGVWGCTYHHTTGRTKECSLWITGIFVSIAVCLFVLVVMSWALVAFDQVLSSPLISVSKYGCL